MVMVGGNGDEQLGRMQKDEALSDLADLRMADGHEGFETIRERYHRGFGCA
jgi:hypothetical protein